MEIDFNIKLVPAKKTDLLVKKGLLKIGQIVFLKSRLTQEIEGPFTIDQFTSLIMIKNFYENGAIYVQNSKTIGKDIHDCLQIGFEKLVETLNN